MVNPDEPVRAESTLEQGEWEMDDTPVHPVPRRSDPGVADKHKGPDVVVPKSWKRDRVGSVGESSTRCRPRLCGSRTGLIGTGDRLSTRIRCAGLEPAEFVTASRRCCTICVKPVWTGRATLSFSIHARR